MRVVVSGDRNWTNVEVMYDRLASLPEGTTIVHGAARGADRLAGSIARVLRLTEEPHPAHWDRHRRAAGPIRNREMLLSAPVDLVLAFHNDLKSSKGTLDMVLLAQSKDVPVELFGDAGRLDIPTELC